MDSYERNLEKGGRVVGNMIGWGLRRLWDSIHDAAKKSKEREALRPGDPNRILPSWQMEVCERAVKTALTYLPDQVAGAIKQSARQLCIDLVLYESKHRKSLAWKMEELLTGILCNLLRNRLDYKLIDAESGEREFFVPLYTLHINVADFIDLMPAFARETIPPNAKPFSHLVAKIQRNFLAASGFDPDRWEESDIAKTVLASTVKGKSVPELLERYLGGTPFTRFFNTSLPVSIPVDTRFEHMHIVGGSGHGKTQLLQNLILHDLHKIREGKRSVVVIGVPGVLEQKTSILYK